MVWLRRHIIWLVDGSCGKKLAAHSHCGRTAGGRVPGQQRCEEISNSAARRERGGRVCEVGRDGGGVNARAAAAGNWFAPPEASP